ncbi:hypothetical protein AK812_SmicGene23515 [Symbiodinium microadriaticum]|uniref:Uncharacterized protein n=1 Tax=Symbiodinium microadriaticum TaxID=2951 RepID=A0A1Q9DH31_SYMMI|nr:hypothetical protein AK812_SmicGene23515 [Symbiodinium microadriaticum]
MGEWIRMIEQEQEQQQEQQQKQLQEQAQEMQQEQAPKVSPRAAAWVKSFLGGVVREPGIKLGYTCQLTGYVHWDTGAWPRNPPLHLEVHG